MDTKLVVVTQSNYIPWLGYFDQLASADIVVLLDDVQYTKRDWRNRNKVKTPQGSKWLSLPIETKGKHASMRICEAEVSDTSELQKHLKTIDQLYKNAPFYSEIMPVLQKTYKEFEGETNLSKINKRILISLLEYLDADTEISISTDYFSFEALDAFNSTERLLELCKRVGATHYLSGPAAKAYMDVELFEKAGIKVIWADYSKYTPYPQLYGEFDFGVSIIDALMMCGKDIKKQFVNGLSDA